MRTLAFFTLAVLCGSLALARSPAQAPEPGKEYVPAEALPRLAESLKSLRAAEPSGEWLQNLLRDLAADRNQPFSPRDFAEQMARKYPELARPENRRLYRDLLQRARTEGEGRPPRGIPPDFPRFPPPPAPLDPDGPSAATPFPTVQTPAEPDTTRSVPPSPSDPPDGNRPPDPPPVPQPLPGVPDVPNDLRPEGWPGAAFPPNFRPPAFPEDLMERFHAGPSLEQVRRAQQLETAVKFWEQNFGRMDETPAVKSLLTEMFTGSNALDRGSREQLAALLEGRGGAVDGDGNPTVAPGWEPPPFDLKLGDWKFPDLGLSGWGGAMPPTLGSSGDRNWGTGSRWGGASFGGGGGSWWPVVVFVLVLVGALVLWRYWPELSGEHRGRPRPLPGLGPWPVDPRTIADRESLVRAFEYLSIRSCGDGAKVLNHVALAAALRAAGGPAGDVAEPLARFYALARYTPADEPLSVAALAEARDSLCRLAGVSAP